MRIPLLLMLALQEGAVGITVQTLDGNTVAGTTEMTSFELESTLGRTTIPLKRVKTIRMENGTAVVNAHDGTIVRGKISPENWKLKSSLGDLEVKVANVSMVTVGSGASAPVVPPPAAEPRRPGLAPAKTIRIEATISRTARSRDGKKLYALDVTHRKVHVVDVETFEQTREIPLAGDETLLSLAPSGEILLVAGMRAITAISLSQGNVLKTILSDEDILDLCAVDDETAVINGKMNLLIMSLGEAGVLWKGSARDAGPLYLTKDGKRIIRYSGTVILPDWRRKEAPRFLGGDGVGSTVNWEFAVSPDGRFLVEPVGTVYRLGRTFVAERASVAWVQPHWAAVWSQSGRRLLVVTSRGFVKEYDTETWEMARSWQLSYLLSEAYSDESGRFLYGVGRPPILDGADTARGTYAPRRPDWIPVRSNLVMFEVPK